MPRKQLHPQKRSLTPEVDDFVPKNKKLKVFSFSDKAESNSLDQCVPDVCMASISENKTKILNSTVMTETNQITEQELELSINFNTIHESTFISDRSIGNKSEFVPLFASKKDTFHNHITTVKFVGQTGSNINCISSSYQNKYKPDF